MKKAILALSAILVFVFVGSISAQQPRPSGGLDGAAGKGKPREGVRFDITGYSYITAQAVNPTFSTKNIVVVGANGFSGYLHFSDDPAARKRPGYNANTKTISIYYPESFLPHVIKTLEGPGVVFCQVDFYADGHIWASVESPMIKRP